MTNDPKLGIDDLEVRRIPDDNTNLRDLCGKPLPPEAATSEWERLAGERLEELRTLREKLAHANSALAETRHLAIARNRLIQELNSRLDYDESEAIKREMVIVALKIHARPGIDPLDVGETEGEEPSPVASRNDIILVYRRIMRRQLTSEDQTNPHLEGAPTLRALIRDLVGTVSPETIAGPTGPLSKPMFDDRDYLAVSFAGGIRYKCFVHHYQFVTEHISDLALRLLLREGVPIYTNRSKSTEYSVVMNIPPRGAFEGELCLAFRKEDRPIYALSFSFVPGSVVGLDDPNVILVCAVQGMTRSPALIRESAKDNADASPAAILFAAVQGIARATGVERIVAVAGRNLVSFKDKRADEISNAYDSVFATVGAIPLGEHFFVRAIDTPEKPLSLVKPGHRLRTKAKRRLKAEVVRQVGCAWPVLLDPAYEYLQIADRLATNPTVRCLIREAQTVATVLEGMDKTIARLVAWISEALQSRSSTTFRLDFEERLLRCGLFDEKFYLARNSDVAEAGVDPVMHYLHQGASEGRDPSAYFSTRRYLADNPGAAESGMNPLVHYCLYGAPNAARIANRYGLLDEFLESLENSDAGASDEGFVETMC